jgi:hypothetical protein
MANDHLHFGGVPTDPDIRRIRQEHPDHTLTPGTLIRYEDVERLIQTGRDTARFRTVTDKWRRQVEDETGSVVIGTEPGLGFKVLTEAEKLNLGYDKLRSAARSARRSYVVAGRVSVSQLSEEDRERHRVLQQRNAAVISAAQVKSKAQLPEFGKDNQ